MRWYLDMDPGIDDAVALAVALNRGDVAGITTVAGNVDGEKTFRNAGRLLKVFGRPEVPVVPGARRPLFLAVPTYAEHVHGPSGLEGYPLAEEGLQAASDLPAWQWMAECLRNEDQPVDWVATGPLTNVARFLGAYDDDRYRARVRTITVMGGSLCGGNVTDTAEFNFYADPDAADFVLGSGWPVRMVGLDVTMRPGLPISDLTKLGEMGTVGAVLALGSRTIARPSATRWRCPPDNSLGFLANKLPKPKISAASFTRRSISARGTLRSLRPNAMFSYTVICG